jgi:HKD family nuclease
MVSFSIIGPLDQPLGNKRLLQELKAGFNQGEFSTYRMIVAYAKTGPLYRLYEHIAKWRLDGAIAEAIVGIDQQGTSKEALELMLELFNRVYVTQSSGITFHPKIYTFLGTTKARAHIGSNNLTVGGTEKNFETTCILELNLPDDANNLAEIERTWQELLPENCQATRLLTSSLLQELVSAGLVLNERDIRSHEADRAKVGTVNHSGTIEIKPESPIPASIMTTKGKPVAAGTESSNEVRGFAIQVRPHSNGEIHLSVSAALQNPKFFKWPFNGKTIPKKAGNPSYPQLLPDPIVNITVFGAPTDPLIEISNYALNTVYYSTNSEIRITASPILEFVPEFSIMIFEESEEETVTYDITIHRPDSPSYGLWLSACNQTMPSGGGGKVPRKFGWF